MKTKNTTQKINARMLVFAVSFFLLSLFTFAQDSCILVISKDFKIKISNDLLAYADIPEFEEIIIDSEAGVYIVDIIDIEEDLKVESWMAGSNFNADQTEFEWSYEECEEELELEDWMASPNEFVTDEEPELNIENWMTEAWLN